MKHAFWLSLATALALLGGCAGYPSSHDSWQGPATHDGQPGYYPNTGGGN